MSGYQLINKPAPLGIKTLGPRPCNLPQNAGQTRRRFCSSSRTVQTLEVCGRISYCFYYVNFGLLDVTVMMKLYFMHIILYLLFTVFWLKDNEVIFGSIGLMDTVVRSNLSYNQFSVLSV